MQIWLLFRLKVKFKCYKYINAFNQLVIKPIIEFKFQLTDMIYSKPESTEISYDEIKIDSAISSFIPSFVTENNYIK